METKERNYGIDLLRIVSMFMVVVLHVLGHGGILDITTGLTLKGEVAWFLEIACYCAVNCYALISGYVAYKSNRKWRTFISLWLQVVFYCILINVVDIVVLIVNTNNLPVLGGTEIVKIILNMFLPVLTNQYCYFTAYAGVFLCMPILNIVIKHAPRNILKVTIISLLFILYIGERLFSAFSFGFRDGYSFPWLALVYVIGGYMAKYNSLSSRLSVKKSFLYYGLCIALTFLARVAMELIVYCYKGMVVKNGWESLIIAYTMPTILLAATFLLNAFSRMKFKEKYQKIISLISPLAFGVYLIHTHPIVFAKLEGVFIGFADSNVFLMVVCVILMAICIYIICTVIEILRVLLFKLCRVKKLSVVLENLIKKIREKFSHFLGVEPGVDNE